MAKMFDAMKFGGDKITQKNFDASTECKQILGVYQIKKQYNEDGDSEYLITSTEPDGKLIVFEDNAGDTIVMYIGNDVETSCLVDLL